MHRWLALLIGFAVMALAIEPALAADQAAGPRTRVKAMDDPNIQALRQLFATPENRLDLARAKVAIDRMIDPAIDEAATLKQLDELATSIRNRFPAGASSRAKLDVLLSSLYRPGPWNDHRPFSYDLSDPLGTAIRNKLLSTYLTTRKGNCVSMPILVMLLGQKLGLDVTLATAPLHVLVKFQGDDGQWINVETTSGGFKQDASYQREMGITPLAMTNQIYLRPLSKRESLGVIASTLMEHYGDINRQNHRIQVANLALEANPKDTEAMLQKGNAYFKLMKAAYMDRYRSPDEIPMDKREEFAILSQSNIRWFQQAEGLGWIEPTATQDANYLQGIQRKQAQGAGRP